MNRGVDTRVVVASGALALLASLGCAGQDLAIEARRVREQLRVVREHGAYHCAPRQLARAETQVEFAERELDRGEFFRAEDHLLLAEMSVAEANRLSPASRCAVQGPPKHPPHVPELPEPAPRIDRDEDGIPDAADRCPTEPEDKDGFEDDDGCPDPDNDQDGVADAVDKCPTEPGPASTGGCPVSFKMIAVTAEKIELKQAIFFASNKATILSQSYAVLDEVAEAMRVRSSMSVRIEGHTDGRGARDSNLRLSQARAEAVRAYLVGKSVDAGRLETKGYGPDHPIDSNKTAAGRDRNRRVDFFITQQ